MQTFVVQVPVFFLLNNFSRPSGLNEVIFFAYLQLLLLFTLTLQLLIMYLSYHNLFFCLYIRILYRQIEQRGLGLNMTNFHVFVPRISLSLLNSKRPRAHPIGRAAEFLGIKTSEYFRTQSRRHNLSTATYQTALLISAREGHSGSGKVHFYLPYANRKLRTIGFRCLAVLMTVFFLAGLQFHE